MVDFVDEFLLNDIDEKLDKNTERPKYPKKSLLTVLIYAEINRVSSTEEIADLVNYYHIYKFVVNDLKPSARNLLDLKKIMVIYLNLYCNQL